MASTKAVGINQTLPDAVREAWPEFDGQAISDAMDSLYTAKEQFDAAVAASLQYYVDQCASMTKKPMIEGAKALKANVVGSLPMLNLIEVNALSAATVRSYAESAARAYWFCIPFAASLHKDPTLKRPGSRKASSNEERAKAGTRFTRDSQKRELLLKASTPADYKNLAEICEWLICSPHGVATVLRLVRKTPV